MQNAFQLDEDRLGFPSWHDVWSKRSPAIGIGFIGALPRLFIAEFFIVNTTPFTNLSALMDTLENGTVGRIEHVPFPDAWAEDKRDLTNWMQNNIDVLNASLGIELIEAEHKQEADGRNVDLLAESQSGDLVVIETQLGDNSHDHLGKVLTHLASFEAKAAIWIAPETRPEQISVVSWINENTADTDFYLVKIEAVRIADSPPAPLFTTVVGPDPAPSTNGSPKKELAERDRRRRKFWAELLPRSNKKTSRFSSISLERSSRVISSAGAGFKFMYRINEHDGQVGFAIDFGDAQKNQDVFGQLHAQQNQIEAHLSDWPTEWIDEEDQPYSIVQHIDLAGWADDQKTWPAAQEAMTDAMVKLEKALLPHLSRLSKEVAVEQQ